MGRPVGSKVVLKLCKI